MMLGVNFKLAISSIRSAKMRSFLTMFAVIIGVAAFVIITTTVEGLKTSIASEIDSLGGNLITISPGKSVERDDEGNITELNFAAGFGASTLTDRDLKSVQKVDGVEAAAPGMIISGVVARGDTELKGGLIMATNEDFPQALGQSVEQGEFFTDDRTGNFVVIGQGVVDELFSGDVTLGSTIQIRGEDFTIIGVMEEYESLFAFGPDFNKAVFIPFETGKKLNGGVTSIQEIDVQVEEGKDANQVASDINVVLLENHGGEEDFTVLKQDEIIETTNGIFDILKNASQVISYIMLFVGAIVILLIMMITVSERTKEIGIRKSIGAAPGHIRVQFLIEALVLTWVGSLLGVLLGFLLGFLVKSSIDITPNYTLGTMIAVVIIATAVGTLGGLYPAYRASRLDPVEALRHE